MGMVSHCFNFLLLLLLLLLLFLLLLPPSLPPSLPSFLPFFLLPSSFFLLPLFLVVLVFKLRA
jgi:hypothetical protein